MPEMSDVLCPNDEIARYLFKGNFIRLYKDLPPVLVEFDEKEIMGKIEKKEKEREEFERHSKKLKGFFEDIPGGMDEDNK